MKVSEMDARQRKAFYNIKYAAQDIIGGLENTTYDYPAGSEDYEEARATLEDHGLLVRMVYDSAISEYHEDGFCCFNASAERYLREIRFCGKEFLLARCEARVKKMGY